jgi:glycosyltransferase involved in cell wall biosynthesis
MKIALLHPFSWPEVRRGGERYAHDLAWWLRRAGHHVDYITGASAKAVHGVDDAQVIRLAHPHPRRLDARGVTRLDSFGVVAMPWLARHRYDVVHAMVPSAAIAACLARQRVVYTAIGHAVTLTDTTRRKDRYLFRRAIRSAAVVTALSASAADAAVAVAGRRPRVLPPGIRLDVFTPELRPRTGPPRLLFAADASDPRKRLTVVLDAMPAVLRAFPDARLVIGGPGALPDSVDPVVRAAVDTPGAGAIDDVPARFRNATLSILPSVNEAFGLVLIESLACGTPVVASDSGGIAEIVDDEVGHLVPPDDADALARAIIDVVIRAADPTTAQRCADHAKRWDWDAIGPLHLAAYRDAIQTS